MARRIVQAVKENMDGNEVRALAADQVGCPVLVVRYNQSLAVRALVYNYIRSCYSRWRPLKDLRMTRTPCLTECRMG